MKRVAAIMLVVVAMTFCAACSDLGRTVGKVGAKLERNVDAFGEGYEQGRAEEMKKTAPNTSPSTPAAPSKPSDKPADQAKTDKPGTGTVQTAPRVI